MSSRNGKHRVITKDHLVTITFGERAREVLDAAKEGEMIFLAVKVEKVE